MAFHANHASDGAVRDAVLGPNYPFSVSCWFLADGMPANFGCLFSSTDHTPDGNGFRCDLESGRTRAVAKTSGAASSSNSGGALHSTSQWHHAGYFFVSSTNRLSSLDGMLGAASTNSKSPANGLSDRVAHIFNGTTISSNVGFRIAEFAIWDRDMRDCLPALAHGAHPSTLFPGNLKVFLPLDRVDDETGATWSFTSGGPNTGVFVPGPQNLSRFVPHRRRLRAA